MRAGHIVTPFQEERDQVIRQVFCGEEFFSHVLVVRGGVEFGDVVGELVVTGYPRDTELLLPHAVI